jgi:hypothetical protein
MLRALSNLFLTPNRKDQLEASQTPLPSDGDEFDDPPTPVVKLSDVRHQATANLKRAIIDYNEHEKQSLQIGPINEVIEGLVKTSTTLTKQVSLVAYVSCGRCLQKPLVVLCHVRIGDRRFDQDNPRPCHGLEGVCG